MNPTLPSNEKIRQTMLAKRKRGELAGRIPLGYTTEHRNGVTYFVLDPDVHALIREARALYRSGYFVRTALRIMTAKGLRSPEGSEAAADGYVAHA